MTGVLLLARGTGTNRSPSIWVALSTGIASDL
jgi:hypothetical protein